jgi:TrmH family RNA methyltransferase
MNLRVVLVSPRNPLNIGAAARAMSNFGVFELRLVNPYKVAFLEAKSAVKASAILINAREFETVAEAVADCALIVGTTSIGNRALEHPLRRLESGGKIIARKLASAPVALLFGSEKFGLSNEDMSYCHWLMRIPSREEHGSMNLGQAVAVCLYELIRNGKAKAAAPRGYAEPATAGEVERITGMLFHVLRASGYTDPRRTAATEENVRRLVKRLNLPARDVEFWLGILRQITWKVDSGG